MKKCVALLAVLILSFTMVNGVGALVITFDDVIVGATSYGFDSNGDGVEDIIFSTTDPSGFGNFGPGANPTFFIDEPSLEGSTIYDLRVDFLKGAIDFISFGFALNDTSAGPGASASFEVYDAVDNLLASDFELGQFIPTVDGISGFPEGFISTEFPGTAAYALFDFTARYERYAIDNFATRVPEPSTMMLFGLGLICIVGATRKNLKSSS